MDYKINIRPGLKLPFGPVYNLFKEELYYLREYLNKIEKLGFIRKLTSKVALLIMFVAKKDSDLRPIVDFRAINAIIVPNRYPILLISEILNRLNNTEIFTKLDLRGAYNLIRVKEGYKYLIAFRTRHGLYEYLVMPFGLYNALVIF